MENFVYVYNGNRASFTLKGIAHLKTKEDFKKVFDGLVDVNQAWKDVVKARPNSKDSEKGDDK